MFPGILSPCAILNQEPALGIRVFRSASRRLDKRAEFRTLRYHPPAHVADITPQVVRSEMSLRLPYPLLSPADVLNHEWNVAPAASEASRWIRNCALKSFIPRSGGGSAFARFHGIARYENS